MHFSCSCILFQHSEKRFAAVPASDRDIAGFCFSWGCCPMEEATRCEGKEHCKLRADKYTFVEIEHCTDTQPQDQIMHAQEHYHELLQAIQSFCCIGYVVQHQRQL